MHFVVHALDKPGALHRRQEAIVAHREYLDKAPSEIGMTILMSGPLLDDDGETMKGSFFLLAAPERAQVEQFFAQDPLFRNDVWDSFLLTRVHIRTNIIGYLEEET